MPWSNKTGAKAGRSLEKRTPPHFKAFTLAADAGKRGNYRLAVKILGELICETDAPPEAWLLLGRSFHALKDYSRALAAFNDYIGQRPASGEGYFFAGRTYLGLAMPYKAVPLLRKALENSPGKSSDLKAADFKSKTKALLGTAYLKSKHSQAAVEILQEAVEEAPEDKRIYRAYLNSLLVRGIRLCRMGSYDLGRQMLAFVLENREETDMGDSPILRLELGRASRETGRLEEALQHFTAALELTAEDQNSDRRIRWSIASILMALGKNVEAVEEIEKIRSVDAEVPNLPWNSELVDLFMIRSFMGTGEWRRAAGCCRDWLNSREDKPLVRALYAEALRNLGDFKAAHNQLRQALKKEPEELDFWYADILVSWEGKDYKSVKKAIKAANSLGGDTAVLERFRILCKAQDSDDSFEIITLLQNAIRTLGPDPELMTALAEAYLKVGLLEEAASWFKKTTTLKKDHESAWLGHIAALEALQTSESGNAADELASLYETYLEIWPSNFFIRRDRASFFLKSLDYADAASELEKLLVWEPSNPSLRRVLAYTYRKTGRFREAAMFLKALLKENPRDSGLLIEYSGCLFRAGAKHYALEILEKAKVLFEKSSKKQDTFAIILAMGVLNFRQKKLEVAFGCFREAAIMRPDDPRPYEWLSMISKKSAADTGFHEKQAQKRKK